MDNSGPVLISWYMKVHSLAELVCMCACFHMCMWCVHKPTSRLACVNPKITYSCSVWLKPTACEVWLRHCHLLWWLLFPLLGLRLRERLLLEDLLLLLSLWWDR